MGFEAFRVELSGTKAHVAEADEVVRKVPYIKPDKDSVPTKGSTFYVLDDGQHAIECEVKDSPVRISCRFTLCHPPSVDLAFLGLLRELMFRLSMEAKIRDDVHPAHSRSFSLPEFSEFMAVSRNYIAARRADWTSAFGERPLAATSKEVYQQIILPQCQPVTHEER
jgi:hypothetical protein